MDGERGSTVATFMASPTALAFGGLVADVAMVVLPLADGQNQLSFVSSAGIDLRAESGRQRVPVASVP